MIDRFGHLPRRALLPDLDPLPGDTRAAGLDTDDPRLTCRCGYSLSCSDHD